MNRDELHHGEQQSQADRECPWCGHFVALPCRNASQWAACDAPETTAELRAARPSRKQVEPVSEPLPMQRKEAA